MASNEFQKKFNTIANEFNDFIHYYTAKRRYDSFEVGNNDLILEVGSATGNIAQFIDNRKLICSDFSFNMCKQAKKKVDNVVCCSAENLPFKNSIFDKVICTEVIYYLSKPNDFITNSKRVLKPEGTLFITSTNQEMVFVHKIRAFLRSIGIKKMYFDDGIKRFMDYEKTKMMLLSNGFSLESTNKLVLFPFQSLDKFNRILERTFLKKFALIVIIKAIKSS